jgi:hypothetical protein
MGRMGVVFIGTDSGKITHAVIAIQGRRLVWNFTAVRAPGKSVS